MERRLPAGVASLLAGHRSSRLAAVSLATVCLLAVADAPIPSADGGPDALDLAVEEHVLANGMRWLFVPRPGSGIVEAGWVVRAGSVHEASGASGAAHLVEHMLFKGSRTVSARDWERERPLLDREDELHGELLELIAPPEASPSGGPSAARRSARVDELLRRLGNVARSLRELVWLGEFSFRYSEVGATGLNANTAEDYTVYYVTLPAEALETWFWLESDRLLDPVFREFYKERGVVLEERRLRVASTPTGRLEERIRAEYWGPEGYGRPVLGNPDEVEHVLRSDVRAFFERTYAPDRITAALVGDVDTERARELAEVYFGRLQRGDGTAIGAPPPARANGSAWSGTCACPTQARIRYPTVPISHPDTAALQMLAGLFNGRAGRLYRSLVLEQEVAFAASAVQRPLAHAGVFEVALEAKGEVSADELVEAWDRELERLLADPPETAEIERTASALVAGSLRRLKEPNELLRRLLVYDALDDWRGLAAWPARIWSVDAPAVRRAARTYLAPERRWIAEVERGPETTAALAAPSGSKGPR